MGALADLARAAGRAGQDWHAFTFREDVGALCDTADNDVDAALSAWEEGNREHRIASGWVVLWTTAPADYDTFGTETVEGGGTWYGKELRRVIAHPHHVDYQRDRYGSGLHGSWLEDPRVELARLQAEDARRKAEDEARTRKRADGLGHLAGLGDSALDALDGDALDAFAEEHGLSYVDVRDEKKKRESAKRAAEQAAEWERCAALVPDGCTILDKGTKDYRGVYGWIKGQPTHVYYRCKIARHWSKDKAGDPDEATIENEGGAITPSLAMMAEMIASGRCRVVEESEVPPRAVAERFGLDRVEQIKRVETAGRVVWVGTKLFSYRPEVVDERGRIVRAKKVVETALLAASQSTKVE